MDRLRAYALAGIAGVGVLSLVPAVVALLSTDLGPPEALPRWLILGLLIAQPAVIGAIGVLRRDRVLLIAAAGACIPLAVLSVVIFPIVIAALFFLVAAISGDGPGRRWTWLVAPALVALTVGSLVGLVATTETRCWVAFEAPAGGLTYRDATPTEAEGPIGGPGGPVATGCDGGAFTTRGVGLALVLAAGAVMLAHASPRPRTAPA